MDMAFVQTILLPIVYVLVGIALIWALVELVMFLRSTRKTVATLEEEVRPVISDVKAMTESLKPAVDKMDPLAERVSLAVDAANLEIMRLDGILENVDAMTSAASSAVSAVDTVANTPLRIVNSATEKLREAFGSKKASDASVSLGEAAGAVAPAQALGQAQEAPAKAEKPVSGDSGDVPAPAAQERHSAGEKAADRGKDALDAGYFTYTSKGE